MAQGTSSPSGLKAKRPLFLLVPRCSRVTSDAPWRPSLCCMPDPSSLSPLWAVQPFLTRVAKAFAALYRMPNWHQEAVKMGKSGKSESIPLYSRRTPRGNSFSDFSILLSVTQSHAQWFFSNIMLQLLEECSGMFQDINENLNLNHNRQTSKTKQQPYQWGKFGKSCFPPPPSSTSRFTVNVSTQRDCPSASRSLVTLGPSGLSWVQWLSLPSLG